DMAGLEIGGLGEVQVESDDVMGEPARRAHNPGEGTRRGHVRLGLLERNRDLELARVASHALTHEELACAFEIPAARGLRPFALDLPSQEGGLAGTAGAGRALVGQLDAVAETGVQDLLARLTGEFTNAGPGADVDVHERQGPDGAVIRASSMATAKFKLPESVLSFREYSPPFK